MSGSHSVFNLPWIYAIIESSYLGSRRFRELELRYSFPYSGCRPLAPPCCVPTKLRSPSYGLGSPALLLRLLIFAGPSGIEVAFSPGFDPLTSPVPGLFAPGSTDAARD